MAKRNALSSSISMVGHFTRSNLERMGALLDNINTKSSNQARKYQAVELGKEDYERDLFRDQTLKTTQQLIGTRFATYGKYAKKVVPNSMFQSVLDSAFVQVAKLAANWSQMDLPNEHRFADVAQLDDEQRYALATDIANQNRALATLGGITGLAGLPGLLADTLWLLLVSLRTVYQLAAVYDQPLTGKQGIKMAYELLSRADLSKMQEKQALLAGIGVGKGLLDNAQSRGLHSELKNLGLKNQNVNYYAEQVDSIASQVGIDLDNIDLTWIRRFLPITAVGVGMRYNSQLIDEVIGVAQATFAPEPKLANTLLTDDNKKSDSTAKDTKKADATDKRADKAADKTADTDAKKADAKKTDDKTTDASKKADDKADTKAADSKKADTKATDSKKADVKANTGKKEETKAAADKVNTDASKQADKAADSKTDATHAPEMESQHVEIANKAVTDVTVEKVHKEDDSKGDKDNSKTEKTSNK
ncbi:EcsC family protein [Psychrobacter aestuarii]|uniref:EcsC family protein n=1 Tax=Psychrobacter aestuarii TaxID=556327 RepID=A0ABN0VSV2_9GAMM|nr:EcsC family protein [Psychrobacter aestuarii]